MKVQSWLSTCSSKICVSTADDATEPPPVPPKKLLFSDSSSGSSASHDTIYSYGSNLSIQTLPSVPSLQKLSPEALSVSVSHRLDATVNPRPGVQISSLAVHHNLLYAAAGKEINVFDISDGFNLVDTFNSNDSSTGSTKSVAFCDGKVITAHQNSKIRVWEMKSGTKLHKTVGSLPTVNDLLRRFIFPANYVSVRRHRKRLWIEHQDAVSGLSVSGGNFVCSVSWDKYLKIWGEKSFKCLQSIKAHDDAINAVVSSADGMIYTASADRKIKVWGRAYGERKHALVATLEKHKSAVNALALNEDGTVLFSGACDRSILVWEREDSANHMVVAGALRGHSKSKAILCLINVSDLLLSGSADRTVRIWQRGGEGKYCCLSVLDGHERPVKSLAAAGDETAPGELKVFSGSFDGEIKAWNVTVSRHGVF